MPSQFFGLTIAYTGLLASNAALNTTSNNIANVQTEGFSRQQVTQQASNALRVFQTYGCAGAGVETLAIERIRDEFYDYRYWNNNAKVGEYGQKQYYMQQIESYFDDNGKNAGFKTVFDQMIVTGMEELLKNPNSVPTKEQFVGYAGSLAEYFNGVAGNLEKLQKDTNLEIKVKIDEINSLAGEIATLNKQINTIELTGVNANELRDRRTLLMDQLSQIVDVDVTETKIADANNPDRETGGSRFIVRIAGGQVLIDGNNYNSLECVARSSHEKVHQTDIDGLYDVYWADGSKLNLYSGALGGALRGLVEMRDGNNGENFSGVIQDIGTETITTTKPDGTTQTTTHDTVTIEVDKHYLKDLNKCNLSDQGGVISLGNKDYYYDSWEYSIRYDENGNEVVSYKFILSDSELNTSHVTNDRVGKTATVGTALNYQGVPYYMSQMNEWIRTFSQKFNDILVSGYAGDIPGIELFTANKVTEDAASQNGQYLFPDATRYDKLAEKVEARKKELMAQNPGMTEADAEKQARQDTVIKVQVGKNVTQDSYYVMKAQNLDISNTLENDPSRLATKKKQGDGVEQNDLLKDLQKLATDKDKMSFRGSSASEFLQGILADVALNMKRANTFYQSFRDVAGSIDTQRLSISGVDEDEEAVNLVRYQNGYNLASKMVQTLTEIYDRLILQTGV